MRLAPSRSENSEWVCRWTKLTFLSAYKIGSKKLQSVVQITIDSDIVQPVEGHDKNW
jgi:hypothetical protein